MKTNKLIKITIIIINLLPFILFYKKHNKDKAIKNLHSKKKKTNNSIIYRLKKDEYRRIPKYILLMDFYPNPYCNDLNAYYIFDYYQKKNNSNAYYVINSKSNLYKQLIRKNKTQNIIPIYSNDNIFEKLYNFF